MKDHFSKLIDRGYITADIAQEALRLDSTKKIPEPMVSLIQVLKMKIGKKK